jgi:hypothetical protein
MTYVPPENPDIGAYALEDLRGIYSGTGRAM